MRALKGLGCLLAKQENLKTSSAFISCSFRPGGSGRLRGGASCGHSHEWKLPRMASSKSFWSSAAICKGIFKALSFLWRLSVSALGATIDSSVSGLAPSCSGLGCGSPVSTNPLNLTAMSSVEGTSDEISIFCTTLAAQPMFKANTATFLYTCPGSSQKRNATVTIRYVKRSKYMWIRANHAWIHFETLSLRVVHFTQVL